MRSMRFMMLMIPRGYEQAAAGVLLALDGLPPLDGGARVVLGR